jgi:hypothetical protein
MRLGFANHPKQFCPEGSALALMQQRPHCHSVGPCRSKVQPQVVIFLSRFFAKVQTQVVISFWHLSALG